MTNGEFQWERNLCRVIERSGAYVEEQLLVVVVVRALAAAPAPALMKSVLLWQLLLSQSVSQKNSSY